MTSAFMCRKPISSEPKGTCSFFRTVTCRCFLQLGQSTSFLASLGRTKCSKEFNGIFASFTLWLVVFDLFNHTTGEEGFENKRKIWEEVERKSGWAHSLNNLMTGQWSMYPTLSSRSKSSVVSANTTRWLGDVDAPIMYPFPQELVPSGITSYLFGLAVAPINHTDPTYRRVGVRLGNVKNWVIMDSSFDRFPRMGVKDRVPLFSLPLNLFFYQIPRRVR